MKAEQEIRRRRGRPAGEVRQALLSAAEDLVDELRATGAPFRGPTLREITVRANLGRIDARMCIQYCKRSGALQIVGERRVAYRNRPVAEYAPGSGLAEVVGRPAANDADLARLAACLQTWAR